MRVRSILATVAFIASSLAIGSTHAQPTSPEFHYVTMSDGVDIAISVWYPKDFDARSTWPTLFEMEGYEGANYPYRGTSTFSDAYVQVRASVRGTGCSAGTFDLFSDRSARDGYELIENWIVQQPWSNGRVGITGHSYPGLTGFYVAATHPPHLGAVAIGGLIDDYYRGIIRMGGILNKGFPVLWAGAARAAYEYDGFALRLSTSPAEPTDAQCDRNLALRSKEDVASPSLLYAFYSNAEDTPGGWAATHSLLKYAPEVRVPIQISNTWQDDQTGARGGAAIFQRISEDVPKRLILTNGRHSEAFALSDVRAWLDCWLIAAGNDCGDVTDPSRRVRAYFETLKDSSDDLLAPLEGSDFPLPPGGQGAETNWRRLYLRSSNSLSFDPPDGAEFSDMYATAGAGPQAQEPIVDAARYRVRVDTDNTILGPITADIFARLDEPDGDLFVTLTDVFPDGGRQVLERGMLRASHREVDRMRSDKIVGGPLDGEIYRPWHPHVDPQPVVPGAVEHYAIEIFPLGHVLRVGHTLEMSISAPPPQDPISVYYSYDSLATPVRVEILHDQAHPSSLLLPFLASLPPMRAAAPACGEQRGGELLDAGAPCPVDLS